jgi:FixJ family two-component response regulator
MNAENTIYVIDDDSCVREALEDLLSSFGFVVFTFGSVVEYTASCGTLNAPSCLILDVHLPDMHGLHLQDELAEARHPPIVLITGNSDATSCAHARSAGAVAVLPKPFGQDELLAAIDSALQLSRQVRARRADLAVSMYSLRNYGPDIAAIPGRHAS